MRRPRIHGREKRAQCSIYYTTSWTSAENGWWCIGGKYYRRGVGIWYAGRPAGRLMMQAFFCRHLRGRKVSPSTSRFNRRHA